MNKDNGNNMENVKHVVFGNNYTPTHLFADLEKEVPNMKECVVVWMTKDNDAEILSGWTTGSGVQKLGMLQVASSGIIHYMGGP